MQIAYPSDWDGLGFWTGFPNAFLPVDIDETGASPTGNEFIASPDGQFSGDYDYPVTIKLAPLTGVIADPVVHTQHRIRVWAYKSSSAAYQNVNVALVEGGAGGYVIESQEFALTTVPTEYSWVITAAAAANITNYNNLYFTFTKYAAGTVSQVIIYCARLELPDKVVGVAETAGGIDDVVIRAAIGVQETAGGIESFLRAGSNYSITDLGTGVDNVSYTVNALIADTASGVDTVKVSPWAPEVLELLTDPTQLRFYLVILYPLDPATGSIKTLRFSEHGYRAERAAGSYYFEPRVSRALDVERNMYRPEAIGGASFPAFGRIVLINEDGGLSYFRDLIFDGYRYEVYMGGVGFKLASRPQWVVVFRGVMERLVPGSDEMVIEVKDDQALLEVPVAAEVYEGTGNAALDVIWGMATPGVGGTSNSYLYADLTGVADYTIQTGDYLVLEIFYPRRAVATQASGNLNTFFEIEGDSPSAWSMRGTAGCNDQNGVAGSSDVSAYANDAWFERRITLSPLVGKVIARYMLACEKDLYTGDVRTYYRNIRISAYSGTSETVRKTIWMSGDAIPAVSLAYNSVPANQVFDLDARIEGPADLAGTRKPFLAGEPVESFPIPISRARLIYQFHVRDFFGVTELSDNAYALTPPGQPSPQYAVDLKRGWVRLLTAPTKGGVISGKVKGDVVGGYLNTAAGVAYRLFTNPGPLTAANLDLSTLTELNALAPAAVGLHVKDDSTILANTDKLMNGAAGFFGTANLGGLIKFGQIKRRGGCVELGTTGHIDFGNTFNFGAADSFAVEGWVQSTGLEGNQFVLFSKIAALGNSSTPGLAVWKWAGANGFILDICDGTTRSNVSFANVNTLVAKAVKHHFALIVDRQAQALHFLIDGAFVINGANISGIGSLSTSSPFLLGRCGTDYAPGLQFDDFRVWSYAPTQAEIQARMSAELTGDERGLLLYAKFNGNANDSAGARNGTPTNKTVFRGHSLCAPEYPAPVAVFTSAHVLDVQPITTPRPSKRVRLAYGQIEPPFTEDQVAGGVSDARKDFITKPWRHAVKTSDKIASQWAYADDPEPIETALIDATSAESTLEILFAIYGPKSEAYKIVVKGVAFSIDINAIVEVYDDSTGTILSGRYLVVGAKYDTESDEFELTIFRPGVIPS